MIEDGFWFYKRHWRDKISIVEVKTLETGLTDINGKKVNHTLVYEIGFREPMYLYAEALENGKFYQKIEIPDEIKGKIKC